MTTSSFSRRELIPWVLLGLYILYSELQKNGTSSVSTAAKDATMIQQNSSAHVSEPTKVGKRHCTPFGAGRWVGDAPLLKLIAPPPGTFTWIPDDAPCEWAMPDFAAFEAAYANKTITVIGDSTMRNFVFFFVLFQLNCCFIDQPEEHTHHSTWCEVQKAHPEVVPPAFYKLPSDPVCTSLMMLEKAHSDLVVEVRGVKWNFRWACYAEEVLANEWVRGLISGEGPQPDVSGGILIGFGTWDFEKRHTSIATYLENVNAVAAQFASAAAAFPRLRGALMWRSMFPMGPPRSPNATEVAALNIAADEAWTSRGFRVGNPAPFFNAPHTPETLDLLFDGIHVYPAAQEILSRIYFNALKY